MRLLIGMVFAILLSMPVAAQPLSEADKINVMIDSLLQLKDAVFIRNGREYGAEKAADHLRMKWKHAGEKVKTAEDFIRLCATASSMSGIKYQIRLADGRLVFTADYFQQKLRSIEAGNRLAPAQRLGIGLSHMPIWAANTISPAVLNTSTDTGKS